MERVRALLSPLQVRPYRYLWLAQVLSELGDWAARLALSLLVLERTGSAALTGLAVALSLVTWLGPGQVVASAVDRFGRRTVMVGADVVRGVAFLLMVLPVPTWLLLSLAAFAGLATPAFGGARSAAQVEVVPPERYGASLALGGVTQDVSLVAGYLLGGLAVAVTSPSAAMAVNALTFFASAALLSRLPRLECTPLAEGRAPGGVAAAAAFILRDVPVRRAALLVTASTFSGTAAETLVVVFSVRDLAAPAWLPALVLTGAAVVTLVATVYSPFQGTDARLLRIASLLCAGAGAAALTFAALGAWWTVAAFLVAGLLFVVSVPTNIVAGPRFPKHLRSVAMGLVLGMMIGGQAAGAALAGLLAEVLGVRWAVVVLMLPALLVGTCYLLRPYPAPPDVPEQRTPADGDPAEGPAPNAVPVPERTRSDASGDVR